MSTLPADALVTTGTSGTSLTNSKKAPKTLKASAPVRVLDGFGRAVNAASYSAAPTTTEELAALFKTARDEGLQVAFRGSGRSYGDASLNAGGLSLDMTQMNRCLSWDPQHGIIEVEPGVTIEGLWRRSLADGYWPAVVPGTMRPTMGGVLAMNVHGKNNFKVGPSGDHVLDFDLLTPAGDLIKCSREENADLFYAAIGGLGLPRRDDAYPPQDEEGRERLPPGQRPRHEEPRSHLRRVRARATERGLPGRLDRRRHRRREPRARAAARRKLHFCKGRSGRTGLVPHRAPDVAESHHGRAEVDLVALRWACS